jgi:signal transduction histidine kinase
MQTRRSRRPAEVPDWPPVGEQDSAATKLRDERLPVTSQASGSVLHSYVYKFGTVISRIVFGLRFRLLLLVILATAPFLVLVVHSASTERQRAVAVWQDRSRRLAELAQKEEATVIGAAKQLLLALSESAALQSTNREVCKKALEEVQASHPSFANLALVATNGELIASVFPAGGQHNHSNRSYFRRVLQTRAFAIGAYVPRSASRRPAVSLGCPVFDTADHLQAVVYATLPLDWYSSAASELPAEVPVGATWMVLDRAGAVLMRHPKAPPSGAQFVPDSSFVDGVFNHPVGVIQARDAKGVQICYASTLMDSALALGKLGSVLGIPEPVLFAPASHALRRNLLWLGLAAVLAFVLGRLGSDMLVIRPVKALVRASALLATGDLSARTGLRHGKDELGELTRAFDRMAQALEQREHERQLAEETLQTRDSLIRELPLLPAAVCVCDHDGTVELYNQTAVELWGCDPRHDAPSRRFCGAHRLFHADGQPMPHDKSPAAEALLAGVSVRNREIMIGRPDGTRVPVLANVVPLRDGEGSIIGVVSCYQDITDRKQSEAKLRETNDRLQLLSRRLVESQEVERRHIARELHDEVGQTLTVAEMNLQSVVQSARGNSLSARLKESLHAVERVLEQVRDLSLNLRPSMLDDLGLEAALKWYSNRQAALANLHVEVEADPLDERLDPIIETACFRIAQEALTNIVRHAKAHSVSVELRREDGLLHLYVRDDGVGFDVAAVRQQAVLGDSLGVLSMEERATLCDGGLEHISAPGKGTVVHAWFPLRWRTKEN